LISSASKPELHSKLFNKNVPQVDAVEMANSSSYDGCQALADFFGAMATRKAHWYSMGVDISSDPGNAELTKIFPSLSTLLSIEHDTMVSVLQLCQLVQSRRGKPQLMIDAWMHFIAEKGLDVEVTTFSVLNKRRYFILIGSWNKLRHQATLPVTCWQNGIFPPKLQISGLTRTFAECVGHLNITLVPALLDDGSNSDSCSLMDDKESELEGEKIDSEGKEAEEKESEEKKLPMAFIVSFILQV